MEVRSGRDQMARPGVARIAARGWRCCAANTWMEGGRDSILPRVVIAGSCKNAKRAQRDHLTIQSVKLAVATLLFCKLICLIKTRSFWARREGLEKGDAGGDAPPDVWEEKEPATGGDAPTRAGGIEKDDAGGDAPPDI